VVVVVMSGGGEEERGKREETEDYCSFFWAVSEDCPLAFENKYEEEIAEAYDTLISTLAPLGFHNITEIFMKSGCDQKTERISRIVEKTIEKARALSEPVPPRKKRPEPKGERSEAQEWADPIVEDTMKPEAEEWEKMRGCVFVHIPDEFLNEGGVLVKRGILRREGQGRYTPKPVNEAQEAAFGNQEIDRTELCLMQADEMGLSEAGRGKRKFLLATEAMA